MPVTSKGFIKSVTYFPATINIKLSSLKTEKRWVYIYPHNLTFHQFLSANTPLHDGPFRSMFSGYYGVCG